MNRKKTAPRRAAGLLFTFAAGSAVAVLTGCGGSGGALKSSGSFITAGTINAASPAAAGRGRASITIHWPARTTGNSRLIPEASNSIVVQMLRASDGKLLQSQVVPRPAGNAPSSDVPFDNLPVDTLTVAATAYPNADGTGTAQATGTGSLTTTADGNVASFGVTMGSTIDHLKLTLPVANVLAGTTQTLTATVTAYNGANESTASVVLLSPGKLTWSAGTNGVATVDSSGVVTSGTVLGTATITVQDSESGKKASASIRVYQFGSDSVGPAQFNPDGASYVGSLKTDSAGAILYTGGWTTISGHYYQFNTGKVTAGSGGPLPTLTDTTTNTVVAYGKLVTQTFGQATTSITYAVFDFPGDIAIGSGCHVTAFTGSSINNNINNTNPLVLLTQGGFTLSGSASLDVSGYAYQGGAGGWYAKTGPGTSQYLGMTRSGTNWIEYYSGASFGGLGGGATSWAYGTDFASNTVPHLQGGSGGGVFYSSNPGSEYGSGGGGALYVGSVGLLTISGGTVSAQAGIYGYGGSGGGIALFGGQGVSLTKPVVNANGSMGCPGGRSESPGVVSRPLTRVGQIIGSYTGGGGGGRIVIGYGSGSAPSTSGVTASGGAAPSGLSTYNGVTMAGRDGTVDVIPFSGF